jgi:hypothetical protein
MGWFQLGVDEVGLTALIAAIVGFWLLKRGPLKALSLGLGVGYLIYGLLFNYHVSTHPYYHLQLIPLVSICMAPTVTLGINAIRGAAGRFWWLPVTGITLILLVFGYLQVRAETSMQVFEDPRTAQEIGEIVNHSDRTVFLAYHYGVPLEYYGEFFGKYWPRSMNYWLVPNPATRELSVQQRLHDLGFVPQYFIITDFKEFTAHHQDLKAYLVSNCSLLAQTNYYLIYKACRF